MIFRSKLEERKIGNFLHYTSTNTWGATMKLCAADVPDPRLGARQRTQQRASDVPFTGAKRPQRMSIALPRTSLQALVWNFKQAPPQSISGLQFFTTPNFLSLLLMQEQNGNICVSSFSKLFLMSINCFCVLNKEIYSCIHIKRPIIYRSQLIIKVNRKLNAV